MNNTKNTKRALLASLVSILLCVSMLIGSTFAWFTDTASTAVNKIQAGTLDVALEMATAWNEEGNPTEWTNAEGKTLNFIAADGNETILWEPGCTYKLPELRVVNKGNLALKFQIVITGIGGDAELNKVIEWDYDYGAGEGVSYYDWSAETGIIFGLTAGGSMPFSISGHMREDAGNEFMGLSIDNIAITVCATQLPAEYDSNNNLYDQDAEIPTPWVERADTESVKDNTNDETKTVVIENGAQLAGLAQLVNEGNTYEGYTVTLESDIDLQNATWTPIGNSTNKFMGNLNGNGHTVSNLNVFSEKGAQGLIGFAGGTVSVTNLTIDGASVNSTNSSAVGAFVGKADGATITFDNLTLTGDVKLHAKSGQVGGILGNNPNGSVYASNITVDVNEGSYVSTEGNMGYYYDYIGGVFGQIWGAKFENITSNIDVITDYGLGAGGISGGATGTWTNVSCSGDVTVLYTDKGVWYSNTNENGNSYGEVKWYQGVGTIIGYHGGVTYTNCTSTGSLLYKDTGSTSNGMTWITSKSAGVAVQDSRFGCSRWKNDNTVTIND